MIGVTAPAEVDREDRIWAGGTGNSSVVGGLPNDGGPESDRRGWGSWLRS